MESGVIRASQHAQELSNSSLDGLRQSNHLQWFDPLTRHVGHTSPVMVNSHRTPLMTNQLATSAARRIKKTGTQFKDAFETYSKVILVIVALLFFGVGQLNL